MNKRIFLIVVGALMVFTGALSGCLPSNIDTPTAEANQATRAAAATAQAELNLLQNEAYELEKDLDANFSEHYVGIQVESYPGLKVIVYLTGAEKADLAPFVENPDLLEVIEVREEEISRETLRATREILTVEMDNAGVTYTTGIKMEPARLEVYVYDIPEAQDLLKTAGVAIPEHVEFIEMDTLPEGG